MLKHELDFKPESALKPELRMPDEPQRALQAYIEHLENEYQPWYERSSRRNKIALVVGQAAAILASAATAFIAGLADDATLPTVKVWLVLLPLIGAFATALVTQTRVREILSLRESGRERITTLIQAAKAAYAANAAAGATALTDVHLALIDAVSELEKQQAVDILSLVPGMGNAGKGGTAENRSSSRASNDLP
jgi:hypothetical protein